MKALLCLVIAIAGCKKPDPARQDPSASSAAPAGSAAATPAGSADIDPQQLQRTTMFAHTTLSAAAASDARTAKDLCLSAHTAVRAVAVMFGAPDMAISP